MHICLIDRYALISLYMGIQTYEFSFAVQNVLIFICFFDKLAYYL